MVSEAGTASRVAIYNIERRAGKPACSMMPVAAKHHANKTGRAVVYIRRGNLVDYMVIALPAVLQEVRANELALLGARRGLYRLKIFDAGRSLVEGIARIHKSPASIAETLDSIISELAG